MACANLTAKSFRQTYNQIVTSRLRINSLFLPLTTIAILALQIINPSPVWKGLLVVLGGSWLISYLWANSLQANLDLDRAMRFGWVQVGDILEEKFVLFNSSLFPATWVEITDHSTLPGYSISRATGVGGQSQNAWHTTGVCARRGVYTLGNTIIRTGDPLGIYRVEISLPESVNLMVMPPVVALPEIEITPGGWLGDGQPRNNSPEQTVSSVGIRKYVPGDSLRLIHWATTARLNEPYVRSLEGAPVGDWWIILDFNKMVQEHWDESETTEELGVILAASLADRGLKSHRAVGLISSGKEPIWMRPQSGEHRRWEILRALTLQEPGEDRLANLLESAWADIGHSSTLIVITSSTERDWVKPLAKLYWRGIIPTVIMIDPYSFGAPAGSRSDAKVLGQLLTEMNIPHHILNRDLFKQADAHPGPRGQWEWRIMPTGKAVPVRHPGDLTWKSLK
jgi:uncharacterized protein (DUF58 family)